MWKYVNVKMIFRLHSSKLKMNKSTYDIFTFTYFHIFTFSN